MKNSTLSVLWKKICCCGSKSFSSDLSKGHIRVRVGDSVLCKFELEANFLDHPLFEQLLQLSGEEFGYSYDGALRIACEIDLFQYLVELLRTRNPLAHCMDFKDLVSKFNSEHRQNVV
ncbi:hypothetical protein Scep_019756 [Stephania cephalantha]|uniref:Small auxin up regulated protein n=1 Tax=Stephania cephalantha TaxID=152367 RepID=A0AAP0NLP4_9MAGN